MKQILALNRPRKSYDGKVLSSLENALLESPAAVITSHGRWCLDQVTYCKLTR